MNLAALNHLIQTALKEDAAFDDITTQSLITPSHRSKAYIIFKEDAVICGLEIVNQVFKKLDPKIRFHSSFKDGQKVKKNTKVTFIEGPTRAILAGERTALNFLAHCSGVATLTRQFVEAIKPSKAKILDTRKTTPGLRELEKYAVVCGGGTNHRHNLSDMALIKDNHLATAPSLSLAVAILRAKTSKKIEVEVTNLKQFQEAIKTNPDIILLDNMTPAQIKHAVKMLKSFRPKKKILLEASGGIDLQNVRRVAQTGVDRISIGALTHSAKAINLSLEIF